MLFNNMLLLERRSGHTVSFNFGEIHQQMWSRDPFYYSERVAEEKCPFVRSFLSESSVDYYKIITACGKSSSLQKQRPAVDKN